MEQKPIYFDGSGESNWGVANESAETFQMTDEVRKNIGKIHIPLLTVNKNCCLNVGKTSQIPPSVLGGI